MFNKNGSSPIEGKISDRQVNKITGIPISTLRDWKESYSYRRGLYWLLKSMNKEQLLSFKAESKIYYKG